MSNEVEKLRAWKNHRKHKRICQDITNRVQSEAVARMKASHKGYREHFDLQQKYRAEWIALGGIQDKIQEQKSKTIVGKLKFLLTRFF